MKFIVAICFVASSVLADEPGDLVYAPNHASPEYYSYPRYAFEYSVKDPHTGDNKAQWEQRDGDVVKGAYSLVDPDGTLRIVEYWADDKHGFNAAVKRLGAGGHSSTHVHGGGPGIVSVGPVANLGHLSTAPLISGPAPYYHGHSVSTASFVKEDIPAKIEAPVIDFPVYRRPIQEEPIRRPLFEPYPYSVPYNTHFPGPIHDPSVGHGPLSLGWGSGIGKIPLESSWEEPIIRIKF